MKTTKIIVKDLSVGTLSNADGVALRIAIDAALSNGDSVIISLEEINTISSSFLNSSIGEIIDSHGFDVLKNKIKITHYTPSLSLIIKKYIDNCRKTISE